MCVRVQKIAHDSLKECVVAPIIKLLVFSHGMYHLCEFMIIEKQCINLITILVAYTCYIEA